ncbi:hypothetical protein [Methylosinus sp. PW1]|uniref:hypothetical protein n=1 Tax=Methylosinus sp. PW1 TaxID=107636 RepID=UPI0012EB6AD1|nr:hypothetical protein [Methylosinus sp. PW1]
MAEREEREPAKRGITPEERYEAERAASYHFHKQRGSMGIHYHFYPQDRPRLPPGRHEREFGERER